MNRILIISVMLAITSGLFAQTRKQLATKAQIEKFFSVKTVVVMDADPFSGFNMVINDAMEKYWTITPYEVVPFVEFERMRNNSELSFIWQPKVKLKKDKKNVHYLYMDIVMGGIAKDDLSMPILLPVPLAYTGVDEDDYVEKLPLMLRFAQIHINNLRAAPKPNKVHNLKNYSDNSRMLKDMVLLVQESDLSDEVNSLAKIKAVYPGVVKIVTAEEIEKAIENKEPNTAVLHQIGPAADDDEGRSYRQIYGTADALLYYYNFQKITKRRPAGMSARDFRLICGKWI